MYVGIRDVTLFQAGYADLLSGLQDLGVRAVELALGRDLSVVDPRVALHGPRISVGDSEGVATLCEVLGRYGVRVPALLLACNLNADDLPPEITWASEAVRVAGEMGVGVVRIDAAMTGQRELSLDARVRLYADAVLRILEAAPDTGAVLAIENHGAQGTNPKWLQAVLDRVNSPRVGVALDTANYYWAGHPLHRVYEYIARFAPHTRHVHCKNLTFPPQEREQRRPMGWGYGEHVCPLPDGDIDHRRVAVMLHRAGYEGSLTIEDESLGKFDEVTRRANLRRTVQYLAEAIGDATA